MNYMNELFETWLVNAKDTPEADAVMQKFCADDDENYDLIVNFIEATSRQGFEAGFDCAVQLLKIEYAKDPKDPNTDETDFSGEEWRKIDGHENYSASTFGRIRNDRNGYILRPLNPTGYCTVSLDKKGCYIHRIIAQTFLPNPEQKPLVNHKDGNRRNNRVSNLEWATQSENIQHAVKMGLHTRAIPIAVYYHKELIGKFTSHTEASKALNISDALVNLYMDTGKTTSHGYLFQKL